MKNAFIAALFFAFATTAFADTPVSGTTIATSKKDAPAASAKEKAALKADAKAAPKADATAAPKKDGKPAEKPAAK